MKLKNIVLSLGFALISGFAFNTINASADIESLKEQVNALKKENFDAKFATNLNPAQGVYEFNEQEFKKAMASRYVLIVQILKELRELDTDKRFESANNKAFMNIENELKRVWQEFVPSIGKHEGKNKYLRAKFAFATSNDALALVSSLIEKFLISQGRLTDEEKARYQKLVGAVRDSLDALYNFIYNNKQWEIWSEDQRVRIITPFYDFVRKKQLDKGQNWQLDPHYLDRETLSDILQLLKWRVQGSGLDGLEELLKILTSIQKNTAEPSSARPAHVVPVPMSIAQPASRAGADQKYAAARAQEASAQDILAMALILLGDIVELQPAVDAKGKPIKKSVAKKEYTAQVNALSIAKAKELYDLARTLYYQAMGQSESQATGALTAVQYLGKALFYIELLTKADAKFKNEINKGLAQELYDKIAKLFE